MHILEIGPGYRPAKDYINRYPDAKVTFVGNNGEDIKFDYKGMFRGSSFFTMGFLRFVIEIAIMSDPYDLVIASNVLNLADNDLTPSRLASGASKILNPGGVLIIENTMNAYDRRTARMYANDVEKWGFSTICYFVEQRNPSTEISQNFVNTHVINANGTGFSLHATK